MPTIFARVSTLSKALANDRSAIGPLGSQPATMNGPSHLGKRAGEGGVLIKLVCHDFLGGGKGRRSHQV